MRLKTLSGVFSAATGLTEVFLHVNELLQLYIVLKTHLRVMVDGVVGDSIHILLHLTFFSFGLGGLDLIR